MHKLTAIARLLCCVVNTVLQHGGLRGGGFGRDRFSGQLLCFKTSKTMKSHTYTEKYSHHECFFVIKHKVKNNPFITVHNSRLEVVA